MEFVGKILKKNREIKKLSLSDVSKELKISEDTLSNIENDYVQNDIDIVFLIGHLRSYCSFLNLNQNELIKHFKEQHFSKEDKNFEIQRPTLEKKLLFSNKLIALTLIVIIFSSFYFLFIEVDKPQRQYALIPDLPENYISTVEKANLDNLTKNKNAKKNNYKNFAEIDNSSNSSSAIASLPKTEKYNSNIITLKFLDDTWFQLRDENDEIVLSQLMNKNDEYSYSLDLNYSITSGNAGHIMVIIDQKIRGKIGKKGQVVDSLVLNKDFSN
jgi:cytoskeletal protein RodZ